MAAGAIKAGIKTLLDSTGLFADTFIGERKDYGRISPVAAITGGDSETELYALGGKAQDIDLYCVRIYVSYDDQGAAEQTRDAIKDTLTPLFHLHRRLGGSVPDVIDSKPTKWRYGYTPIAGSTYLSAEFYLLVESQYPIIPAN